MIIGLVAVVVLAAGVALVLNGTLGTSGRGGPGDDSLPHLPDGSSTANGRPDDTTWVPPDTNGNPQPDIGNPGNSGSNSGNANYGTQIGGIGPTNTPPVIERRDGNVSFVSLVFRGLQPDANNQPRIVLELRAATANPLVRAIDLELIAEPAGLEPAGEVELRRRRIPGGSQPNVSVQTSRTPDGMGVRLITPDGIPQLATLAVVGFRVADQGGPDADEAGIRHHRVKMRMVRATMASGTVEEWPGAEAHVRFRPTE